MKGIFVLLCVVCVAGMGTGIAYTRGADERTAWIRADLAKQGCALVQRDAGDGQAWVVECGGDGR